MRMYEKKRSEQLENVLDKPYEQRQSTVQTATKKQQIASSSTRKLSKESQQKECAKEDIIRRADTERTPMMTDDGTLRDLTAPSTSTLLPTMTTTFTSGYILKQLDLPRRI